MTRKPATAPPYVRPMQRWWRRDPYFMHYMLRETTAFAVAAYAIVLCAGAVCLSQGEAAWNSWLETMRSPLSILLHLVLLVAMFIHAKSWFEIMPKTMPMLFLGGRRLPASAITWAGWAATIGASALLYLLARWAVS